MSRIPVDIGFLKVLESGLKIRINPNIFKRVVKLRRVPRRLLKAKLVAREGQNPQASVPVIAV